MAQRICILGATGMLGQDIQRQFANAELIPYSSKECDMNVLSEMKRVLLDTQCDTIINCAAYTKVDDAEDAQELAMHINGEAVGVLGEIAKTKGIPLVHYSTDYVFNGANAEGYLEDDSRDPVNIYGASKALGEQYLEQVGGNIFIIRTAWLYGAYGMNFVKTMLDLATKRDALTVVNDQWGCPTWTKDLAAYTASLLHDGYDPAIYHGVNSGQTSWFHFAEQIFALSGIAVQLSPTTSDQFPRKAKRPSYSILRNTRGPQMRAWQDALAEYVR